jgi:hypothetical protein
MRTYITTQAALELGNALLDAVELARDSNDAITIEKTCSTYVACRASADCNSFLQVLPPDDVPDTQPVLKVA